MVFKTINQSNSNCAFSQYYRSEICDDISKLLSEELNVEGNVYDKIEAYSKYKKKHYDIIRKEYEMEFVDYRKKDSRRDG